MRILLSEDIWDFDLDQALTEISDQRREQALKFKHEQGRRLCVLAYQLLQRGLREEYGIEESPVFEYSEHGKPSIAGHPEIYFNLSHCKYTAVCALSDSPVGIDVESVREYKESLARYTMNDDELQRILTAERPDVAFIRFWTMKEALLKLTGDGISNNLKTVLADTADYHFNTIEAPDTRYLYTVCRPAFSTK